MTLQAFAVAPVLGQLATTGVAGFALQNGTPNILQWTAPSDGLMHRFIAFGNTVVGSAETGGAVQAVWTAPTGAGTTSATIDAGGTASGTKNWTFVSGVVAPGATVTIKQSSALTVGAAVGFCELWGS